MRYRTASKWQKPIVNPYRFLRNQIRKGLLKVGPAGMSRVPTVQRSNFRVIDGEWVSEEIAGYGVYEPELTEAFIRIVEPGSVVVDVGMHLGYYSTLFAELVGDDGLVVAFEPTPSTRAFAAFNTEHYPIINVRPEALWSEETIINFNDYGLRWMAFNGTKEAKLPIQDELLRTIKVNCVKLDDYVAKIGRRVALVKIDAENAELEILKGGEKFLKRDKPLLSLEVGDGAGGSNSSQAVAFAVSLGYKLWEVTSKGLVEHESKDRYSYGNLILSDPSWKPSW